jgi:hypothetical protein
MRLRRSKIKAQRAERAKVGLAGAMVLTAGLMLLPACKSGMSTLSSDKGPATLPLCSSEITNGKKGEGIKKQIRDAIDNHIQFMWDKTKSIGVVFRSAKLFFTLSLRVNESGMVEVQDVAVSCKGELCPRFAGVLDKMGNVTLDGIQLPDPQKPCGWKVNVTLKLLGS